METAVEMPSMSDDEWEEVAQTVPSIAEPFIQKYLGGREALIAEEKKQRSGAFSVIPILHRRSANASIRLCLPAISFPHRARCLRDCRPNPGARASSHLDCDLGRSTREDEGNEGLSWDDVLLGEADDGEDEALADTATDAQGRAAACAYGRDGGLRLLVRQNARDARDVHLLRDGPVDAGESGVWSAEVLL
jgi:hypothetical protein